MNTQQLSFTVIGMSDELGSRFPMDVQQLIQTSKVFSGGVRHHELLSPLLPEGHTWIDVTVPLSHVFDRYRELDQHIVVFASGDPLFFGYTTTLMREFPGLVRKTYPYYNSLQLLAHAIPLPYHDMRVCSLTGRPWDEFDRALIERTAKLGVLTDKNKTPSFIAERMCRYGYSHYRMHIGVRLGGERQEVYCLPVEEVVGKDFAHPNCIILEATQSLEAHAPLGLSETAFHLLNGRAKMITKMPIRLLSLHMLELHRRHTLWDVGFCTGSVSVEAKLQSPHLKVVSFEIRPEGDELIQVNAQRFGTPGIEHHIGDFMTIDVSQITKPDAVFIGGHGGEMKNFLIKIKENIDPDGVIVFNSVSESTLALFEEGVEAIGWHISSRMLIALDDHNPITIMQAKQRPNS